MIQKFLFQAFLENQLENQSVLEKFKLLEALSEDKMLILGEKLNSFGDDQVRRVQNGINDKKGLNEMAAGNNGITVEQLVASPNYEHLIEEYMLSLMMQLVRDFMCLINDTLKELEVDIKFSEDEIITMENATRKAITVIGLH